MRKSSLLSILLLFSCFAVMAENLFIAGDGRNRPNWCCGEYWDPSACPLDENKTYETTLDNGTYSFKITNGAWGGSMGIANLDEENSIECSTNSDGNIIFSIEESTTVTIRVLGNKITVNTSQQPSQCNPMSGTLPVIYIFTENNAEITSKDVYLNASYYLDANGVEGYESIGSADAMLTTKIKGRGNYTWTGFDKKPYRLKLEKKAALMGMKSNKHFALLAHADEKNGFLRNTLGFECSRLFGLDYTPAQEPLELFVNGQYRGIYFLTELIRIDKDRVNITEQEEEDTDPYNATGGWLLEIDNYDEDPSIQFRMIEKGDDMLKVTSKSPEVMSEVQYNYMYNYLYNTNKAIQDKGDWEKYIDIESLVNLYLVYEVMGNHEGFHGSCYMHKERGDDTKLVFGPAWDFGSSLGWEGHIYESPLWGDTWIDDLAQFPQFQAKAGERWQAVRPVLYPRLRDLADSFIAQINSAAKCDCRKWPEYGNSNLAQKKADVLDYLYDRMQWLDTYWGTTEVDEADSESVAVSVYPNPTSGYISVPSSVDVVDAYVSDLNGRCVQLLDPSVRTWKLNVERGTYMVLITTADGANHVHKIVKL